MKNSGVFAISRDLFDHSFFEDEPYSERLAWVWLIGAAVWRSQKVRVAGHVIQLGRGELAFSERFLAQQFGWSKSRVHRFIARLEREGMISKCSKSGPAANRKPDHTPTHLRICNYNRYAFDGERQRTTDEPQPEPAADQQRTKEEERKEDNRKEGATGISKQAFEVSDAFLAAINADREAPEWQGVPYRADMWLREGWTEPIIISAAKKVMAGRSKPPHIKYFEKAIATEFANQNAPVPKAEPGARRETVRGNAGANQGWQASRDDFREAHAELKRKVAEQREREGGGPGGEVIRLVTSAGRG